MEVILLEKVRKLGDLGDQVRVKSGYGRNYLIPVGKAVLATAENIEKTNERKLELQEQQKSILDKAKARAEKLSSVILNIPRKASEQGKLFGSVGVGDIMEMLKADGIELEKHEIKIPDSVIRSIGEYEVDIRLHVDVSTKIKVVVVTE